MHACAASGEQFGDRAVMLAAFTVCPSARMPCHANWRATAAAPFAEEPPSSIATTTTRSAAVSSGIAAVRTRAGSARGLPADHRGAAQRPRRPRPRNQDRTTAFDQHKTQQIGRQSIGAREAPHQPRRSWRRARVMKGSSPSPRSSMPALADTSLKATGASATMILCRWQKSRM